MESTPEQGGRLIIEIEEVKFDFASAEDLFIADNLAFHYRNFKIPSRFTPIVTGERVLLISLAKEKKYFEYQFQSGDADAALVVKELPFQITSMHQIGPYISLLTPINGVDNLVFMHEDGTVYFTISRPQFDTTLAHELRDFLRAFQKGYTQVDQGTFTYLNPQFQVELNLADHTIRKYAHGYQTNELVNPDARELMEVTADHFKVRSVDPVAREQSLGAPQIEINITADFLWSD
jgi:hypothetical protein